MHTETKLGLPVGVTLDRFIMRKQSDFTYASGELSQLLRDIALAGKIINHELGQAGLNDISGTMGKENVQGEQQQKLDIIANIRFIRALKNGGQVCAIVSEEDEEIIYTGNDEGKYVVAMDPLDGSSNIDVNVAVGTIFSIYSRKTPVGSRATSEDFEQGGRKQVAAGYVLYGSSTMLVYTTGRGVNGFTYNASLGEFFLSHPDIKTPEVGKIYSFNESYLQDSPRYVQEYVEQSRETGITARYIGSMVADLHRNLLKGGIYLYPPRSKAQEGKLRLLYECYPLAFLVEQAGGRATDGQTDILDKQPSSLHQRSPLYIGSKLMVEDLLAQVPVGSVQEN